MKKIAITRELLGIANQLDNMKMFQEANALTKIANIVVAEDYKHDPMVYNPDDAKADVQEAHSMDYLEAMEVLNKLVESGELEPRELSQIQSILSDSDDEGPDPFKEMSFDDDDIDYDDDSDYDDEDPEDPNAWQYEEDQSDLDDMEHKQRGRGHHEHDVDFDDF